MKVTISPSKIFEFGCETIKIGHKATNLNHSGDWSTQKTVFLMSKKDDIKLFKKIKKNIPQELKSVATCI